MPAPPSPTAAPPAPHIQAPLLSVFSLFLQVGLTSFGGGAPAWIHRELVERRRWLDETAFLTGLTIAQFLPGANPVNLALYFGYRLHGGIGAIVAAFALVTPAFCIVMTMGYLYRHFGTMDGAHAVLIGVASVGVGMTLSIGAKLGRHVARNIVPLLIAIAIFIMVGVLRWPMIPVVLIATPLSILLAYYAGVQRHG
jgi:chromate transporter